MKRFYMIIIAFVISLLIKDAITSYSNVFLPFGSVDLKMVPCEDGTVKRITIVYEGKSDNEIFDLLKTVSEDSSGMNDFGDKVNSGWVFTEGISGESWTRIESAAEGDEISFNLVRNPDYYFVVFSNGTSGAFEMTVNDSYTQLVDTYDSHTPSTQLLKIHPFENDHLRLYIRMVLHVIATLFFYIMISLAFCVEQKNHIHGDSLVSFHSRDAGIVSNIKKYIWEVRQERTYWVVILMLFTLFNMCMFLFLNQARGFYYSDFNAHIQSALNGEGYSINTILLWLCYTLAKDPGCAFYLSVIIIITVFVNAYYLVYCSNIFGLKMTCEKSKTYLFGIIILFLAGIYIPNTYPVFYLYYRYSGVGSPAAIISQPWHNSTYILMRPFALITLILFFKIYSKYQREGIKLSEWFLFTIMLTLTNSAKPNFFLAFAPAMLLFLLHDLFKYKLNGLKNIIIFGLGVICSMSVLMVQYIIAFTDAVDAENANSVIFTMNIIKKLWNEGTLQPLLVTSFLFVVPVTILCVIKKKVKFHLVFGWLMVMFALFEAWFMAETGSRGWAGNFGWGIQFCMYSLTIMCVERIISLKPIIEKRLYYIMITPLVMMNISGIVYFMHLLDGGHFIK